MITLARSDQCVGGLTFIEYLSHFLSIILHVTDRTTDSGNVIHESGECRIASGTE
jgi:hypothetical protein